MWIGELAGLATAGCWAITSIAFEFAGKKIGSGAVNIIRLMMAFIVLGMINLVTVGSFMALDITSSQIGLLAISGLIGFVIGDLFLFEAFVIIGARISMLIMALSPPISALIGYLFLGESMGVMQIIGMFVTTAGISFVILNKGSGVKVKLAHPIKGIIFALLGAIGQSVGLLFSKIGMGDLNAFAATQYRVLAGLIGFFIFLFLSKRLKEVFDGFKSVPGMKATSIGAFFGPVLGVSLSLVAAKYTSLGVAATLMGIVPVIVIPVSVMIFKERVNSREVVGALIAVVGVALLVM